ncbi:MAG TPA: ABC transporter permease [Sorangium sp.]|nr:ABC transporter permease [Sorangium sp.]
MLAQFWVVFRKELRDALRDRRAMLSMLIFPLVGPLLTALILTQAVEQSITRDNIRLPVRGAQHAPAIVAQLEANDITVVAAPERPITAVREQQLDMVLLIDEDFVRDYRASNGARLTLLYDASRNATLAPVKRIEQVLQQHNAQVGALRLLAHGVNPGISRPLAITRVDVSTPRARGSLFLNGVAMFVLMAAFVGGMYTATDVTAGERERGSLEPLLVTPTLRTALVLGKWLVTVVLALATVGVSLAALMFTMRWVPTERLGVSVQLSFTDVVNIMLIMLPLCLLSTALQLFVATFAHTFKEAQTYLSLLMFVPMVPAVALSLTPLKLAAWNAPVPVLGQQVLLNSVMRGEALPWPLVALAAAVSIGLALAITQATAALFKREKVIFGR